MENSAAEKPLLPQDSSDKQVNMTVTSMDSALSNSDNCSDIEMENIHKTTTVTDTAKTCNTTTTTSPLTITSDNSNSTTSSPGHQSDSKAEWPGRAKNVKNFVYIYAKKKQKQ